MLPSFNFLRCCDTAGMLMPKMLSDKDIQAGVRNIFRKFDVAKN